MHSTFNFCQCPYHRRAMNMIPATSSSEGGLPVMETCRALLAILRPRKSRPHSPMPPLGCWGLGQRKLRNPTIVCFWVIGRRKGVPFRCKAYRSQGTDQAPVNTDRRNASSFQLLPDVPSSPMCLPLTWLNSEAIHHLIRSSAPHYVAIAIALEHRLDLELSHRPNLEAGIPGPTTRRPAVCDYPPNGLSFSVQAVEMAALSLHIELQPVNPTNYPWQGKCG
jgi:hypothetical protein